MKKATVKIPAKINLTLDVTGRRNGYHEISSLVCRIDVYDEITVIPRKDGLLTLSESGIQSGCSLANNNAYKAGRAFMAEFNSSGADILLKKGIPVGAGLGGSSADIAGVLIAMKKAYGIDKPITGLADSLGSDSGYMSLDCAAVITGRGEIIDPLPTLPPFYLLLITETEKCSSADCYKQFDVLNKTFPQCTDKAKEALKKGDKQGFAAVLKNDLTESSVSFVPQIKGNIAALKNVGAKTALMTGSGSCVYGVFFTAAAMNKAYKNLLPVYGERLIKAKTL